jgi:outer membrane protein TolC
MTLRVLLVALGVLVPAAAGAKGTVVTFEQALEQARSRNESFLVAAEELERAQLARDRAWAAFLPTLKASGTFTHSDREITREFGGQQIVFLRQNAFASSLSGSLVLLKGTSIPELMRAYREAAAAEQVHRWARAALEFEVARAYVAALAAENLVAAALRTQTSAEEHLAAARVRRQAGEALSVDVTRARIAVVEAQGELVRARNARESSLDYLAYLIGQEPPVAVQRPQLAALEGKNGDPLHRPDVRAGELRIEAAQRGVTGSWLDYLPTLTLVGTYQATQNTGFSGDPDSWNVMLSLDWLLFDGGLRRATRHQRASELRELRLRQRLLERDVARSVRQARRDVRTARVALNTAQERLRLARQNRELVLSRYRAGLGTSLELVEADDALRKAEVAVIAEELNLALKALELLQTLGLDPRGRSIAS